MEPFALREKEYYTLQSWENEFPNLVVGFTSKNGGYSIEAYRSLNLGYHVGDSVVKVRENKKRVAELINFPLDRWVAAEQTHGINLKKISGIDVGKGSLDYIDAIKDTDGFYTSEKGILLSLCFADCVPIYFLDKTTKTIGIAHAGWKGTVNGIAKEMIQKWTNEGSSLKDILVVIGPSICEKCYIVDDYVINFVKKVLVDVEKKPYNLINEGQYQLNLKLLNKILLIQSGIPEANITISSLCSSCHATEFFSHRRDKGTTGRMMSFIGFKEV